MDAENITIEFNRSGRTGAGTATAKLGDEVLAVDTFNIGKATARAKFAKQVSYGRDGINAADVERELLRIAGNLSARRTDAESTGTDAAELDISRVVRPELFHTPDVSGIAVPVPFITDGHPAGRWMLYLRWHANGAREGRELGPSIEVPDAGTLWLHPSPGEPLATMRPGWSARARAEWLSGRRAPDGPDVFRRICEWIARHVDFSSETAAGTTATLALWAMLTYVYSAWRAVPYLNISGPLASGKTRVFEVLARFVFRPLQSSNMTAACLFRTLHEQGGVLLLDEAERLRDSTPDANDLRSILLSGYKLGSPARRLEKVGDGFRNIAFDVFGPKAIAGIARLPEALASRCIRLTMFRAGLDSDKPRRRIDENPGAWAELRDDLHALALEHGPTWLELADRADVCPMMSGRDFELWQPLLALAWWLEDEAASGLLGLMREHAAQTIELSQEDVTPDTDEILLRLLAESVRSGTNDTTQPKDLLKRAKESDSDTFNRWKPKGVATTLRRYGLRTNKPHCGRKVYGQVTLAALRRIEQVYGLDLGLPAGNVPHVPHVPQVSGSAGHNAD